MPRLAIEETPEVTTSREQLQALIDSKRTTGTTLCSSVGARQWHISRFLSGRTKTITPTVRRILNHANLSQTGMIDELLDDKQVRAALMAAWDGSPHGRGMVAQAIQALAPLIRRAR